MQACWQTTNMVSSSKILKWLLRLLATLMEYLVRNFENFNGIVLITENVEYVASFGEGDCVVC